MIPCCKSMEIVGYVKRHKERQPVRTVARISDIIYRTIELRFSKNKDSTKYYYLTSP